MRFLFNQKALVGVIVVGLILAGFLALAFRGWKGQKIEIVTDKTEYENGAVLRLKIRNFLFKNACFSSCYPYNLERSYHSEDSSSDSEWKVYPYQDCLHSDSVEKCIRPFETKAFEIPLPRVKKGTHRISVSVCENCQVGQKFQETNKFYSNAFKIK